MNESTLQKQCFSVVAICCMRGQQKNSVALKDELDGSSCNTVSLLFTLSPTQFAIVCQQGASWNLTTKLVS